MEEFTINEMKEMQRTLQEKYKRTMGRDLPGGRQKQITLDDRRSGRS